MITRVREGQIPYLLAPEPALAITFRLTKA